MLMAIYCVAMLGCRSSKGLVSIGDAPDICPDGLCPAGTEIYRKKGTRVGVVIDSSQSLRFPSGDLKAGMSTANPDATGDLTVHYLIDTEQAQRYYVIRS